MLKKILLFFSSSYYFMVEKVYAEEYMLMYGGFSESEIPAKPANSLIGRAVEKFGFDYGFLIKSILAIVGLAFLIYFFIKYRRSKKTINKTDQNAKKDN